MFPLVSSRTNESHPACEFNITAINITCQFTILKNLKIEWMDTVNFFDGSVYSPLPQAGEKEALSESSEVFEDAAVRTSGLVNLVFSLNWLFREPAYVFW